VTLSYLHLVGAGVFSLIEEGHWDRKGIVQDGNSVALLCFSFQKIPDASHMMQSKSGTATLFCR
jgi:hypothetical protein